MLKLIQLGLTFTDEKGNLPRVNNELCVWQFNFRRAACSGGRPRRRPRGLGVPGRRCQAGRAA